MSKLRWARLAAVALLVAACAGSSPGTGAPGSGSPTPATQSGQPAPTATIPTPAPSTVVPSADPMGPPSPTPTPAEASSAVTPSPVPASPPASPTTTPKATGTPSPTARPTARPTPKPTARPTARPPAPPTPKPVVVELEARDFLFEPNSLVAPADRPFGIAFRNADAAIPHNVTVSTGSGTRRFVGQYLTGVSSMTYAVPALRAGTYRIGCDVHPAMTATLTVR